MLPVYFIEIEYRKRNRDCSHMETAMIVSLACCYDDFFGDDFKLQRERSKW